ncbi:TIGR01458 family HAD-type hydrolase [Alcanivorax sp. S6407]|uniref:TIGR01458 family HAD-type hydrolase n=1 Tax=Alcanivorax sp. S6407 TaxID=2926424 RepID=UPI001FF43BFC|nr:TIGR01458 family HAD-type hydrolase [Alcanivorax sp. S6407]MCK0152260.1 TIGR01458 family HAD-type hydrolase [Alcanivorax sp. S6407]
MSASRTVSALCLDLAGVLYQGPQALPGARQALAMLRATGLPLRFATNTSQRNRHQILKDLESLELDIEPAELFTAPRAAHDYLSQQQLQPYCLIHPNLKQEFADLEGRHANAVLVGDAGRKFDYQHLDKAFRLLHVGAPLIAIGLNRYYQLDDGLHLDAGPFVKALEYASGQTAIITGKPSRTFFAQVLDSLGSQAEQTLMVGDDIHGDVEGALNAGMQACLVQTGKYREGDEDSIEGDFSMETDILALAKKLSDTL